MDVGNDPFPREEVTGLAAFEDLEPVSQLNVVPPEPPPPPPAAARYPRGSAAQDERRDPTLPLDLSVEQAEGRVDADHLFDASPDGPGAAAQVRANAAAGWDDPEEATRVATRDAQGAPSADLQMDWDDDDEPPTQMRPGAMFDVSPVHAPSAWDEGPAAGPIGGYSAPQPRSATQTMSGGQPSPFPSAPLEDRTSPRQSAPIASHYHDTTDGGDERPLSYLVALKSGDRRSWLIAGGAAAGLIALALIVRGVGGSAAPSSVTFSTTPADAKVWVDGKEVFGSSSPYALLDLAAGKHDVIVKKTGFVEYRGSFAVARGESKTMPTVELVPTVREVGFSVRSMPAGAEVWVDGAATDQLTPARLTGVTPGIHRLQLKHDGYVDYELQLFVPEATVLQLPAAELVALPEVAKEPPVTVERADKPQASRSHKGDDDDSSKDSDKPTHSWHSGGSAHASSHGKSSAASSFSARAPAPSKAAPMPPVAAEAAPASSGKLGMLRINSRPWAQVIVDGRVMGNTPQQGLPLSPGKHKVQLVNPQMNLSKTISVTIKTGQVVTQAVNLME